MSIPRTAILLGLAMASALPAHAQNTTRRVSVATNGGQSQIQSHSPAVSADGRYVAFLSESPLVPGDTNGLRDAFVHDRETGVTERVSLGLGSSQAMGGDTSSVALSADGRFVVMASLATNLVLNDTNGEMDVFVRDREAGTTSRVSVPLQFGDQAEGSGGIISADGRYVVFMSTATNLVASDTNGVRDLFRRDRQTGTTIRVGLAHNGAQANAEQFDPAMSADGRFVAFTSVAANLVPGDTKGFGDVFVRDVQSGATTRVSVGPGGVEADDESFDPSISADGRFVAFNSVASNLVAGGGVGVYLHDRHTGVTSALSIRPRGTDPDNAPRRPIISGDGRYVCIVPTNASPSLVLIDRQTQTSSRVDVATNGDAANGPSTSCVLNSDATIAAFTSFATNLVPGDTNAEPDVFARTMFPTFASDRTSLAFAAVTSGTSFVTATAAQTVQLTQSGSGTATWTATSDQPWLQVSPASGAGSATLSISVVPAATLPPSGTVTATIAVSLSTEVVNTVPPIAVTLILTPTGTSLIPLGVVDTPVDNRTGVTGAIPFTGWALDDVEVVRVSICRDAFGTELAPVDPNCGGAREIFVGFAVFIDGARPDVAGAFPALPRSTRAGWGFMVLTNMLPGQGNGQYRFTMRAEDREGQWVVLGTRTMTCANASATLPFGAIDTPTQGGIASGPGYVNFGWALTPLPKTIPIDGSTIQVLVDGVSVGSADYNHPRPDIQALFPGFNNTNGAIGFRTLDTTLLTNGLHTISWTVSDDQGAVEGIGSRFFVVSNGVAPVSGAALSASATIDVERVPLDTSPLVVRRGWNMNGPYEVLTAGAAGVTVIRSEEISRVELALGEGAFDGFLRTPAGLVALPIGSRLDTSTNTFTWAPGVGFVGRYDFVFLRSTNGTPTLRREVRIVLHPKGRGAIGPQVVVDVPRAHATVGDPFLLGGWAVDLNATLGTGVSTLHAWAFPAGGGAPIFLGATAYGGARPDVAAVHGAQFSDSGFGLIVANLPVGDYDLGVFAWSTESMGFVAPTVVPIRVR